MNVLSVKNIEEKYQAENGEITALKNIEFCVKKGEFISIVGASGCGNAPPPKRQLSSERRIDG